ncbi:MAG: adenine phosphoribosyltransferase [Caulobacteraceae bacterium]|jgi:adenine phosphoribosyltransferase
MSIDLAAAIRTIPDHPKPGILFRDITTLLADPIAFRVAVERMVEPLIGRDVHKIAAIEARGFIFGGAIAHALGAGFVPLRKQGKLPHATRAVEYALEYGVDVMEMHLDAVLAGEKVFLVDDLIATGGTALAAVRLLTEAGAEVVGVGAVIDLPDLGGAARLRAAGVPVHALVSFEGH